MCNERTGCVITSTGCVITKIECVIRTGCMITRIECVMIRTGCVMTRTGHVMIRTGCYCTEVLVFMNTFSTVILCVYNLKKKKTRSTHRTKQEDRHMKKL